ncbi:MAG TPA: hypothetical protein VGC45_14045 [Gryllotalpicola sp.]
MIFGKKRLRPVADFNFDLEEGWFGVNPDDASWPARIADSAGAQGAAARDALVSQLTSLAGRVRELGLGDGAARSLVWIPTTAPDHVRCILSMRLGPSFEGGPAAYQAHLAADEGRREPGERYEVVETWANDGGAGPTVGAYNVITYTDLLREEPRTEARTLFGVFPEDCSQMFEFVFTTTDLDGFDDIVSVTAHWVSTLTVELEK